MVLFKYIGKGVYTCIILVLNLCKYLIKGLFAPVLLIKTTIEENKEANKIVKKEMSERKKEALKTVKTNKQPKVKKAKSKEERIESRQKEREEAKRKKEAKAKISKEELKKIKLEKKAEQARIKKEKQKEQKELRKKKKEAELEKKRVLALQKQEEKRRKEEARKIKKQEEKERKRQARIDKAVEKKRRKEELKIKRAEAKEKRKIERARKLEEKKQRKIEKAERKRIIKEETKEERKQRKAREKIEKQEKAKLAKQKKIEAIHEKQKKKENELYRKEKEKQEEKKRKEEAKKLKKEEAQRIKAEKKKKANDSYVNENAVIEKPGMKSHIGEFFGKIKAIPKNISKKLGNNLFTKSARNRRDLNRQALLIDFEGDDTKRSDIKLIYEYEAKSPEGKFVRGHFEAFSKVEVHSFLLSEGYEVYKIHTNRWIALKYARSASNKKKFKNKDLIFFLTQLSTYLKAGITLSESLKILARQFASTKAYENIFKSINYELSIGESFSDTLAKQGNAFPKLLINMLKTAEMTGSLPEVLDDMAEYYTQMEESRRQLVTAMMYPSIVGIFAIAVITFIMVYVVPQFVEIYATMDGTEIPKFTQIVMAVSDFMKANLVLILLSIVVVILLFYFAYKKSTKFRSIAQWIIMKMPVFGNTIIYSEVTTFTKTLGSLLSHNVPIIDCMDILNKITNNEIYKMLILNVITNLARGGKISEAFEGQWAFPVPAYEMIVTGEKTGELSEMMTKVSLYYQDLQKNSVARIKTFVEPALTVFLAGATGIIVMAIVIPMFNMYSAVQDM
mgnify:CR=1 FL=1